MHIEVKSKKVTSNSNLKQIAVTKGPIQKVKEKKTFYKKWYFYVCLFIGISTVIVITHFLVEYFSPNISFSQNNNLNSQSPTKSTGSVGETIITTTTPSPVFVASPVNGVMIEENKYNELIKNKVIGVMIENLAGPAAARPQAGLLDADIVYEAPVEGNISRFMAIFWSNNKDDSTTKLMPIRSARKAFLDWLQEYNDALYMHIGQSASSNVETNAAGALIKYAVKDLQNNFSRDNMCEKQKSSEHCAYTDTAKLWKVANNVGWTNLGEVSKLLYKEDKAVDPAAISTTPVSQVKLDVTGNFDDYGALWTYDSATNTFLRSIGNTPMLDQMTKKQISAKTIVITQTSIGVSIDGGSYHKVIKTLGSGNCWIIQDGNYTPCIWKKSSVKDRTRYFDKTTGKELSLNRGKMWITVSANTPTFTSTIID